MAVSRIFLPVRIVIAVVTTMLLAAVLSIVPAAAASQNEVLTTVLFDGTASFNAGDPTAATGTAPEPHGPGLDGGPQNLVVRTHDQFAVRVDWNVNEEAATTVVLTVEIPDYATWTPDATGMFAGCDPATSTFPDPQTLECHLGDQAEGSNGAIRPVATLHEQLDGTTFDVMSTLTTDDDGAGVFDGLDQPLTVSEAPFVDYIKATPTKSAELNNGSEAGYVVLYPFTFVDHSQGPDPIRGVGPVNDSVDVELFDHMWNLTPNVRLATPAEMTLASLAGDPCGDYAQTGAHVTGNGSWTCGTPTATTAGGPDGTGYPVVPVTVSGFTSRPAPATLANGGSNAGGAPQITSGQIAVWLSKVDVDDAIADPDNPDPEVPSTISAVFHNAIVAQDQATIITSADDIVEAPGQGTSGPAVLGPPTNNNVGVGFGAAVPTGGSGGSPGGYDFWHAIRFDPGPLQFISTTIYNEDNESPSYHPDTSRSTAVGGLHILPGSDYQYHGSVDANRDYIGRVARGQVLNLRTDVYAEGHGGVNAPVHGCTTFDTAHYELVALPAAITVFEGGDTYHSGTRNVVLPLGPSVAPNAGPLAHVLYGGVRDFRPTWGWIGQYNAVPEPNVDFVLEFSDSAIPRQGATPGTSFGVAEDNLTCRDSDAGSAGWVDANDVAGLAQFDADNNGTYEGITRARYRTAATNWDALAAQSVAENDGAVLGWNSLRAHFNVKVKQDLDVNTDGQELFAAHSYSFGELGADGVPNLEGYPDDPNSSTGYCQPDNNGYWESSGHDVNTTTGWCNKVFRDDGDDSFDTDDNIDWDGSTTTFWTNNVVGSSGAMVQIVGVKPGIKKENLAGTNDIKDNGQLVQFKITPSTTGATVEALTNYVVTDNLPSHYQFVQFIDMPDVAYVDESSGQNIRIRYSDATPDADPALPAGIAGGWPASTGLDASFTIEVMVTGAVANPNSPTVLPNSASVSTSDIGPWEPSSGSFTDVPQAASQSGSAAAFSYMPLPSDEGAIIKAVDTLEGPCELHPDQDPPPAGWGGRCSMIDHDGDMSFILSLTNEGNTAFSDIEIVDVFPHNADEVEPASGTNVQGGSPTTLGDGRTPDSDYAGTLGFVSMTSVSNAAGLVTWVSGDAAPSISRDPDVTVGQGVNTWCDAPADEGGTVQSGSGACPATADDVSATYSMIPGNLNPDQTMELRLTLDSEGVECDDIWTNTFGARTSQILLPIRSNDVSIMVNCEFDLALEKTLDPAFTPAADWITEGTTTVDFLIEVTNQEDPIEDFAVTDYVDTNVFTFTAGNNAAGTTGGDHAHPFTWDVSNAAAPVVSVDGALDTGESVTIPVTLIIEEASGTLENWAEISYFDDDGDPSNGDSDPTNANNPSTGALLDNDSTPDGTQANDNQPTGADAPGDGVITGDGDGTDPVVDDEDDHDVAGVPLYDLELIKTVRDPGIDVTPTPWHATFDVTVTNQGNQPVFLVDVTEYAPAGLTYDAAATAALWATESITGITDAMPTFTIAGPIAAGDAVTFPLVFDVTDLTAAPYVNAAEISSFDDDANAANTPGPLVVDVDSTPDATNDDDIIDHTEAGYDPDDDDDLNEPTPGDEDDHDIAEVALPIDLALQKRIDPNDPDLLDGVRNGDELTFFIEVFNQAGPVEDFHVTDYVSDSWIFDPTLNLAGTTTGDQTLPFVWDATDLTKPVAQIDGGLDTGESVVIPVVLTVDVSDVGEGLFNYAEISYFDDDGDPSNGDSDPDNPNNPVDGPLTDIDSTPDQTQGDPMVDDVVDGSGGDEDDHDQAFTKWWDLELIKTRSVGQDYVIDPAAVPLEVSFDITVNNQGPEDAVNVAVTDTPPAGFTYARMTDTSGTISTSGANDFTISALASGDQVTFTVVYTIDLATVAVPAVNIAEISAMEGEWDPDGPLGPLPFGTYPVADIDSVPDANPNNDAITTDGVVDPADSHNTLDNDPDDDGNLHDVDGLDEDDHDSEAIALPYDLALMKTFVSADAPLVPGGNVTMLITVTNQGPAVEQIDVADYLDPSMWVGFNAALNPAGAVDATSTAAAAFSFSWDGTDPQTPIVSITPDTPGDKLLFGESIAIPITVTVVEGVDTSKPLVNVAEIARFDNDGDATNGDSDPDNPDNPATGPLLDGDSTPDADNESGPGETIGSDLVDDSIAGDGQAGNDEDDHDPVIIPVLDLALRKTLHPDTIFPIVPGGQVTFLLEVINQGSTHATGLTVTDYVDPAMWAPFDMAWNPSAMTTGDASLPYAWAVNANGQDGDLTINGVLPPGENVTLALTLTIAASADLETLANTAEIAGATASDATGTEILNPDGSTVLDIDSTSDTTNDDPLVDDVTDGSDGDEDDHDIAFVTPPTYSLGNQVWFDEDNNGTLDADEDPIEGVVVHLFTDTDGDGLPDDLNGDGVIDAADAIATDTTGPDGDYLFTDLDAGDYIVGIAPENWDEGGPLDDLLSSDPTSTDPNDDVDDNDDGSVGPDGYVTSGPVTLNDGEPTGEPGLDNDPNTPDPLSNLTVDFGFWQPVYDLALEKTVAFGQDTSNLSIGDDVTFTIEVFNQGTVATSDISVIDYIPAGLQLNDSDWTDNGDDTASITLTGVTIAAGASTTVDVTMTITAAGSLENHAEITDSTPIGDDGDPLTEPDGTTIDDVDSTPDAQNTDVLSDGITNSNATDGDEDDHDIAGVTVRAPSGPPPTIAFTGRESNTPVGIAIGLISIGLMLVLIERRREDELVGDQ